MAKKSVLVDLGKLKDIYSGLGQVSLHFGNALLNENNNRIDLTFLIPKGAEKFFQDKVKFEYLSAKRRYFPKLCRNYEVWHAVHQDSAYMPGSKNTSYLLTIHDLNFLEEKSAAKSQIRLKRLQKKVDRAKEITCISNFTKSVVEENLKLENKQIEVIYNGVEDCTKLIAQKPDWLYDEKPFLFSIGVIKEKKNFHVLVDFMERLPEYKLVIAGNKDSKYATELEQKIRLNGLANRIILPGKINEEEKAWLYKNCAAFLFPSKYEGFGLPVIEAMQFGKPVFLSTYSSLPEIGGTHAFYWQDFEPDKMAVFFEESMQYFSETPHMAAHMIDYARGFTWQYNAQQYLELYSRL